MKTTLKLQISTLGGFALLATTAPTLQAALYTSGHGDLGVGFHAGGLEPHWHMEGGLVDGVAQNDVEFEADELTAVVPVSSFNYVVGTLGGRAAGAAWDPVGVAAGQGYYFLPQTDLGAGGAAALGAPFLGIGSEELTATDWSGLISLELTGFNGPGDFSLWQDGVVPNFFMSTADPGADILSFNAGGHDHFNWGFTEPGIYELTFTASGTTSAGPLSQGGLAEGMTANTPYTATETFSFQVIPEPSSLTLLGGAALMFLRRRR